MGGAEVLRGKLPKSASLHEFRSGCLIQACPVPQIGDRNRGLEVEEYRELARVLKPIRITTHSAVHSAGGLDRTRFESWLARFD